MRFSEAAVISVQSPDVRFARGTGFAWLAEAIQFNDDKRLPGAPIKQLLEQEIENNLKARGMKLVSEAAKPRYSIAYTAALASSLDDHAIIRQFGLLPGNARIPEDDRNIEKGTLIIYVFDNRSGERVWRSAAQLGVHFDMAMAKRRERIRQVIGEMFLTFPAEVTDAK